MRAAGTLVGLAPLVRDGRNWSFSGGAEVADFLDIIAEPEYDAKVAGATLDFLQIHGGIVNLRNLRPDSTGAGALRQEAEKRGFSTTLRREDVSPRVALPRDWEMYVQALSKKDRHELRRKMRRLDAAGSIQYYVAHDPATRDADVDDFVRLMRSSAENKAQFMTPDMERFFQALVWEFAPRGFARLYFLELNGRRVAATLVFDYGGEFLLYNSGYDLDFASESVGLLLKAFCLRDAIDAGRRAFDFLQGSEPYKYDLGGRDVPIYELVIDLAANGRSVGSSSYV